MHYRIRPLCFGVFRNFEKSIFTYATDQGTLIEVPLLAYLVEGPDGIFLVDTGPPGPELAPRMAMRPIHEIRSLSSELARCGVSPEDIKTVVLTHLHWDHCFNLELFPQAEVVIQRRELAYAVAPLPFHHPQYGKVAGRDNPSWFEGFQRMRVVDGDSALAPGLTLLFIPGHTPGMQGLLVETRAGKYLVASDAFPLYENFEKGIPAGIHVDLREWYASYRKAQEACDFILPGHDGLVLDREVYGE